MFKRLIVPLDGSKLAEIALPYAEEIARHLGSEVILVNVRTSVEKLDKPEYREYLSRMAAVTEQNIKKSADKPVGEKVKVASAVIGEPSLLQHPAEHIVNYAVKENASLIIMATHGRTGISHWALGSTAEKVVRICKCPVMLIRAGARPVTSVHFENIMVPLDGSKEGEASLAYIENFASSIKAKIKLMNIVEMPYRFLAAPTPVGYYSGEGLIRVPYNAEELKPIKAAAAKYIESVSAKLTAAGIKNTSEVRIGSPGEEIVEAEEESHPDLLVMSSHGQSGFGRFDFGSVAEKVLHKGTAPILMVRPK